MSKYLKVFATGSLVLTALSSPCRAEGTSNPSNGLSFSKVSLGCSLEEVIRLAGTPRKIAYAEANPICSAGWDAEWPELKVRFMGTYDGLRVISIEGKSLEYEGNRLDSSSNSERLDQCLGESLKITDWPTSDGSGMKRCYGLFKSEDGCLYWCSLELFLKEGVLNRAILTRRNPQEAGIPWPSSAEGQFRDSKILSLPDW